MQRAKDKTVGKTADRRRLTDDGEGRVQGDVGLVGGVGVDLTTTSHSAQSVEHARAQEAHHGDQDKLSRRRGVPWQANFAKLELLVFPAGWQSHGVFTGVVRIAGRIDLVVGVLLRHLTAESRS